jgi:hypothetical protein
MIRNCESLKNSTSGGGFSLLNGADIPLDRLDIPMSNMKATSLATSLAYRTNQSSKPIRLQYQCKLKEESSRFYLLAEGDVCSSIGVRYVCQHETTIGRRLSNII